MKLIIISGLSGSGKSIALQTLEDEGYYCVDNLPLSFLPSFCDKFNHHPEFNEIALGIDARSFPEDLLSADQWINSLQYAAKEIEIIFLQASDEVLLKRYHDTRRKHPLSNPERNLSESIAYERRLLENFMTLANVTLDTSTLNVHQLRQELKNRLFQHTQHHLSIQLESFGYRNGLPLNADFVLDARALTNPHWNPELRDFTGQDQVIQTYLDQAQDVSQYLASLKTALDQWIPLFETGTRSYLTIAIGCTGGKHRSVYLVERLHQYLKTQNKYTIVRHRELDAKSQ